MIQNGENIMTAQSFFTNLARIFLRPLSFIPALLIMYFIYSFSAQDGPTSSQLSSSMSHKIIHVIDRVFDFELTEEQIDNGAEKIHYYIRKTAHFTEYFILAAAISLPLYVYGIRGIWLMLTALILCVGFACLDEYHQLFVAGRGSSTKDILIDSFGSLTGIVFTRIIGYISRKSFFEPIFKIKHY